VLLQDIRVTSPLVTQIICCLVPPMALQIGTHTLIKSYPKDGLTLGSICGIMVSMIKYAFLCFFSSIYNFLPGTC